MPIPCPAFEVTSLLSVIKYRKVTQDIKQRTAYMDNMDKLFDTLFAFALAPKTKFVMRAKPGLPHLHSIKILHLDKFLVPRQLVARRYTSALHKISNRG
jgi:hypothetical protein